MNAISNERALDFLLTPEQIARFLNVPTKTIHYWVSRSEIPFIRVGRHLRFSPEEVLGYFRSQTGMVKQFV